MPDDPEQPVKVRIELVPTRSAREQRLLSEQVRERLQELGFRDGFLYDHRNYTRLRRLSAGSRGADAVRRPAPPAGRLARAGNTASRCCRCRLRSLSPIVIAEVITEGEGVAPIKELAAPAAVRPRPRRKSLPNCVRCWPPRARRPNRARLEVVLVNTPDPDSRSWQRDLRSAAPEIVIEGHLGPYVTVLLAPDKVPAVAADPFVSLVRLPPSGTPLLLPAGDIKEANRDALRASGLDELHKQGRRGKNIRVAVFPAISAATRQPSRPSDCRRTPACST